MLLCSLSVMLAREMAKMWQQEDEREQQQVLVPLPPAQLLP